MRGVERCSALGVRARLVFRLGLARKRDGEDERTRGREEERERNARHVCPKKGFRF